MAENNKNVNGNNAQNQNQNPDQQQEKKEFFLKRAWAKVPGWGKKAMKIAGVLGVAAGAYALGRGKDDGDCYYLDLDDDDDDNVVAEQEDEA